MVKAEVKKPERRRYSTTMPMVLRTADDCSAAEVRAARQADQIVVAQPHPMSTSGRGGPEQ